MCFGMTLKTAFNELNIEHDEPFIFIELIIYVTILGLILQYNSSTRITSSAKLMSFC